MEKKLRTTYSFAKGASNSRLFFGHLSSFKLSVSLNFNETCVIEVGVNVSKGKTVNLRNKARNLLDICAS